MLRNTVGRPLAGLLALSAVAAAPVAAQAEQFVNVLTGGTSGVGYLRKMLDVVLFPEIWRLRTDL